MRDVSLPINGKTAILLNVCLLIFIDAIGIGIVLPLLPSMYFSAHGLAGLSSVPFRHFLYGLTLAVFPLSAMLGMPFLGRLSDRYGRKRVMLFGLYLLLVGYGLSALSLCFHSVSVFIVSRCVCGFSSGTYSVCNAAIMDISHEQHDKVNFLKYVTLSHVAGFILGPALWGWLPSSHGQSALLLPFILAMGLSLMNTISVLVCYPSDQYLCHVTGSSSSSTMASNMSRFSMMFESKLSWLTFAFVCYNLGLQVYVQSQAIALLTIYGYSVLQIGIFYIAVGISTCFGMFVLQPLMTARLTSLFQIKYCTFIMSLLLMSYFAITTSMPAFGAHHSFIMIAISVLIYAVNPSVSLNLIRLFSDAAPDDAQGAMMGNLGQIESLMTVLASLFIGFFFGGAYACFAGLLMLFVCCFSIKHRLCQAA